MALSLSALKTELQTDPTTLGYAPLVTAGNTGALAALLNEGRAGISVFRSSIPTWEIVANTVKIDYDALLPGDKQLYQILVSTGTVDATDSRIRAMFASIFGVGTTTRTNLVAMASRQGSRAEQLFGGGVGHADVARALAS